MQNILNIQYMTTYTFSWTLAIVNQFHEQRETKMMYCRQFSEQNRKSRIGAQLEPGVVAQKQKVAAHEVHQEEAGDDQAV